MVWSNVFMPHHMMGLETSVFYAAYTSLRQNGDLEFSWVSVTLKWLGELAI